MEGGKKTQRIVLWVSPEVELDLHRAAAAENRATSDFVRHLVMRSMYGIMSAECCEDNGTNRHDPAGVRA